MPLDVVLCMGLVVWAMVLEILAFLALPRSVVGVEDDRRCAAESSGATNRPQENDDGCNAPQPIMVRKAVRSDETDTELRCSAVVYVVCHLLTRLFIVHHLTWSHNHAYAGWGPGCSSNTYILPLNSHRTPVCLRLQPIYCSTQTTLTLYAPTAILPLTHAAHAVRLALLGWTHTAQDTHQWNPLMQTNDCSWP